MIKKIIIIFLIFIIYTHLYSAEDKQVISKILIYGNSKTKEPIIRRALDLKRGQKFDPEIIEKSKKNLMDLKIFTHVDIETKKSDEGVILLVIIKEKPPIFFELVEVYFDEETYKNYWGAKIGYNNLSGKNQELWLTAAVGNLKKLEFGYQNNYFIDFFWGICFSNSWYKNEFYNFKENRFIGKIFVGKKISKLETNLWANYEKIKIDNSSLLHKDAPELFKLGINMAYSSKDSEIFPSKGIVAYASFYKALNGKKKAIYDRYMFNISSFFNLLKRNVLALDFKSIISEGNVPIYDMLFFGGLNTLRGFSAETYSGNSYIVFTSEYRIPIEKPTGTALYFFSDLGSITNSKRDFTLKNFKSNFGIGLFWVLKEEAKLRIDLSVSPKFKLALSSLWKF